MVLAVAESAFRCTVSLAEDTRRTWPWSIDRCVGSRTGDKALRIVMDPGVLMSAAGGGHARTGVFRVASELLRFLHGAPGVEVVLPTADMARINSLNHVLLRDFPPDFARYGCPPVRWLMRTIDGLLPHAKQVNAARPTKRARLRPFVSDGAYAAGRLALLLQRALCWRARPGEDTLGDVYLSACDPLPDASSGVPRLATVYDILPLTHPEWFPQDGGHHEFLTKLVMSVKEDDWVLTISEATRNELLAYCPGMRRSQVVVSYPGARAVFSPQGKEECRRVRERYGIPAGVPYFLGVSTIEIRKNFARAVEAFARFLQSGEGADSWLVLAGAKGWKTGEMYERVAADPLLSERVLFTGYVSDEDLPALYSDALCFVYPSLGEGFGLPVVEAMRCGTAVITSSVSSLPEVAGSAAELVDPMDVGEIEAAMRVLATDSTRRERREREGLLQAAAFTWERFGNGVLEIMARMREVPCPWS